MIRTDLKTEQISGALARAAAALGDMTPLMQDLGELFLHQTQENFRTGTAPDGTAWAPKSMTTIERYRTSEDRKQNAPVPMAPLIGLSKSLSTTISYQAGPSSVAWGSNMIYAAVMQFGAEAGAFGARMGINKRGRRYFMPIPWGDIPARPFLGLGPDDETAALDLIAEYLMDASGAAP